MTVEYEKEMEGWVRNGIIRMMHAIPIQARQLGFPCLEQSAGWRCLIFQEVGQI